MRVESRVSPADHTTSSSSMDDAHITPRTSTKRKRSVGWVWPINGRGADKDMSVRFEDLMARLLMYARNVKVDASTQQLRTVLRLIRSLIDTMSERSAAFERKTQDMLCELGALDMVHTQLCRKRNEPDLYVLYLQLCCSEAQHSSSLTLFATANATSRFHGVVRYAELIDTATSLMRNGNAKVQDAWIPLLMVRRQTLGWTRLLPLLHACGVISPLPSIATAFLTTWNYMWLCCVLDAVGVTMDRIETSPWSCSPPSCSKPRSSCAKSSRRMAVRTPPLCRLTPAPTRTPCALQLGLRPILRPSRRRRRGARPCRRSTL